MNDRSVFVEEEGVEEEGYRIVFCTCPEPESSFLARTIVESGSAACVNIVPSVTSVYRWEGELCEEREALLIIKTTVAELERLTTLIVETHSYEVPEIVSIPMAANEGNATYLDWLSENVGNL